MANKRYRICWTKNDTNETTCGSWTTAINPEAMQKNIDYLNGTRLVDADWLPKEFKRFFRKVHYYLEEE